MAEPAERSRVRLADIAAAARVSVKTVSLALRGDQAVSRETSTRIQELAFRLGYVSRGSKRQVIGVVVPYIGHRVYTDLFGFLRREASSYDFTMLLAEGMGDPAIEKSLIGELRWRGVDGLVLIAPRLAAEDVDLESRLHQPIVTIGMPAPASHDLHFARIEIDHEAGGRIATSLLLDHGRRQIAYLAGRLPSASDQGRRLGYQTALCSAGIAVDDRLIVELERHSVQPWPDYDLGFEQGAQLLSRDLAIDAIVAYSDAIAIGALRAIHDHGRLTVPDDLSIVGFDGLAVGQYTLPRLTSVGFPWYRVALAALEALIDLMDEDGATRPATRRVQSFAPEVIFRESVASKAPRARASPTGRTS
ncbi:MAG TPA: LacI family DNA-binding transcriptional regulator [Chloroflexota bacterium]|nr:LacI family DNA-binding transcriptional regulator [Chloroflexota bacterium]